MARRADGKFTMSFPIDSVYFFMFAGWRNEARSNRWHYGRRWARHVPVVFLQPELPAGAPWRHEPEQRLHNVEILSLQQNNGMGLPSFDDGLIQARQIKSYMKYRNHRRPLFWIYNPYMTFAAALAPANSRIFHATENYFDVEAPHSDLADLKRSVIGICDTILCCSSGVLEGCRMATGRDDLNLIPNGCDYAVYAEPRPLQGDWVYRLQSVLEVNTPIAVFAGNINTRLDFPLMARIATKMPEVTFVYAGAVATDRLDTADRAMWMALLQQPNVIYLGSLDPDDLPQLYHLADRGFIPYRHLPYIVKNGLPLKALEMAAAGLPVVASLMEPLRDLPEAVDMVEDGHAFLKKLQRASRRTRTPEAAAQAAVICRAYDYDRRFAEMLEIVLPNVSEGPPRPAELAPIYERLGLDRALRDVAGGPSPLGDRSQPATELNDPVPFVFSNRNRQAPHTRLSRSAARLLPVSLKSAIKRSLGL